MPREYHIKINGIILNDIKRLIEQASWGNKNSALKLAGELHILINNSLYEEVKI